jgi:Na+/glutamate symporter
VSLTAVGCNQQKITVTVTGVHDDQGNTLASAAATMGLLFGDTNGDGLVDQVDVERVKLEQGQETTSANFREDVTADGEINATDVDLVRSRAGTMLPP